MSSAASDRHVVDSVSDPVNAETCEVGEPEPSGAFKPRHHETPDDHEQRTEQEAGLSERNS